MTPKQILDSFSETLMEDERILSAQERALLTTLLQHAKAATTEKPETQTAVKAVIASAVGETVAQRAFSVLGANIVERILESSPFGLGDSAGERTQEVNATPKEPQPPGKAPMGMPSEPQPPGHKPGPPGVRAPHKQPQPPRPLRETPVPPKEPQPPGAPMRTPGEPQPPGHGVRTTVVSETSLALAERPARLPGRCVILDEFLAPQELEELTHFALSHEADFGPSEVLSPNVEGGVVNSEHRRSRVLMDLERHQDLILARIKGVLPQVLEKLGMEEFTIVDVEVQATASNDGDFFRFHSDSGSDRVECRRLTFVYFFHREPRQFEGGELRIHDAHLKDGLYVSDGSYQTIVPQQNQIVFFPCELLHEITPVKCPSQQFPDSRFTVNGWLRR